MIWSNSWSPAPSTNVWLSRLSIDKKGAVLKSEFNTDLPARLLEKEVNMCNYSEFVANRGRREGKAEDLVNLMESLKLTIEQAMQALKIPKQEWDDYREFVKKLDAHPAS